MRKTHRPGRGPSKLRVNKPRPNKSVEKRPEVRRVVGAFGVTNGMKLVVLFAAAFGLIPALSERAATGRRLQRCDYRLPAWRIMPPSMKKVLPVQ